MTDVQIFCHKLPNCPVCQQAGKPIYDNLRDKLFNVAGTWKMSKCNNKYCKTYWLNPTPNTEDLHKLYSTYSTHTVPTIKESSGSQRSLLNNIRNALRAKKLGYCPETSRVINSLYSLFTYLHPAWRDAQLANLFYMPAKKRREAS